MQPIDSISGPDPPRLVVLGNPGSPRVDLFAQAARRCGLPTPTVISWMDWIAGRCPLPDVILRGDLLRIESPGKDFEVERAILLAGTRAPDDALFARAGKSQLDSLDFDKGRMLWPRQWYLGFDLLLRRLQAELENCATHTCMNDPEEIALMFDKPACHAALARIGVPQPASLGIMYSYDELMARMGSARASSVFLKLAHGSSASGVVAYRTNGQSHQAITSVETVTGPDGVRLYNTRRLRTLTDPREIGRLIDALCPHRVWVERWLPKAGIRGRTFDLRVVVIGGAARHVVARLSCSPMTNLHLLNDRADAALVRERMGEDAWDAAMKTCERVMRPFARSLYAGIDLLVMPDFRSHAVLEVNAFGDQIPGVLHDEMETYDAELSHVLPQSFCAGGGK